MLKVKYEDPAIKDFLESPDMIGRKWFIYVNLIWSQICVELGDIQFPDLTVLVVPHVHDEKSMGAISGKTIVVHLQDTKEEIEKTLVHEFIHYLRPKWDEEKVENNTQAAYNKWHPESLRV